MDALFEKDAKTQHGLLLKYAGQACKKKQQLDATVLELVTTQQEIKKKCAEMESLRRQLESNEGELETLRCEKKGLTATVKSSVPQETPSKHFLAHFIKNKRIVEEIKTKKAMEGLWSSSQSAPTTITDFNFASNLSGNFFPSL